MGQYHKLVNLDKKEYVDPHSIGLGSKQYEQTGCEGSIADAMYLLVMTSPNRGGGDFPLTDVSGKWAGDRVVVLGDYTEDEDLPMFTEASKIYGQLYDSGIWEDISNQVREGLEKVFDISYEEKEHNDYKFWSRPFE